jgi:hypothetical protein
MPANGGLSNGEGLAAIAAAIVGKGALNSTRLFSEDTFHKSMGGVSEMYDGLLGVRIYVSTGQWVYGSSMGLRV